MLVEHDQQLLDLPGRIVHHAAAPYQGDGKTDAKDARIMKTDWRPDNGAPAERGKVSGLESEHRKEPVEGGHRVSGRGRLLLQDGDHPVRYRTDRNPHDLIFAGEVRPGGRGRHRASGNVVMTIDPTEPPGMLDQVWVSNTCALGRRLACQACACQGC